MLIKPVPEPAIPKNTGFSFHLPKKGTTVGRKQATEGDNWRLRALFFTQQSTEYTFDEKTMKTWSTQHLAGNTGEQIGRAHV